jgi:hypothetical protein
MNRSAAAIVGMAALLCAMSGHAAGAEPTLAPSAALNCLTPSAQERAGLAYPPEALERKDGGTVSVELRFEGPDEAPGVRVLSKNAFSSLQEAVRKHVRQFRIPCMKAGEEPVVLRQDFVFVPNDGRKVLATAPRDAADERRQVQMRCLTRVGRDKIPEYPPVDLMSGRQGNLFVSMRFTSAERPPELQVLAADGTGHMFEAVSDFVRGYRLPCLQDRELSMDMLFHFRLDGGARTRLKDMSLRSFIASAKDAPRPAYFDLGAMACPFELRVTYQRPHRPNTIGELDGPVEARKPFLDWLSQLTLALPEKKNTAVLGDEFTLAVPCGKIDL